MPTYKLYYFNGKGFGELSRYLFALGQQEYEDNRFGDDLNWEDLKVSAPFGRAPFLEIDGERFGQSVSIARYLANAFNLAGKTDLEKLKADGKDEERKAGIKKEMLENTNEMYKKLEKQVSGENSFLSSGLSWADVAFYNFHSDLYADRFEAIDLTSTPKLKNILDHVSSNEHIKSWIEKRPVTEG